MIDFKESLSSGRYTIKVEQKSRTTDFQFYFILGRSLGLLQANRTDSYVKSNDGIIDNDPQEFINVVMNPIGRSSTKHSLAPTLLNPNIGISSVLFKEYMKS